MTNDRPGFTRITDDRFPEGAACRVHIDRPGKRAAWLRGTIVRAWRQDMHGHTVVEAHVPHMDRTYRSCHTECVRVVR